MVIWTDASITLVIFMSLVALFYTSPHEESYCAAVYMLKSPFKQVEHSQ